MSFKLIVSFASLALVACSNSLPPTDAGVDAGMDVPVTTDATDHTVAPDVQMPIAYTMPTVANAVSNTDPRWNGQYHFLYDAWGTEVLGEWPPASFIVGLMTSEPAVFGNHLANFGFIPDPNDPDGLPFGFKRGLHDTTQIHETCAMCHTAQLPDGTLWFGAPNVQLDVGRFRYEVNQRWVAAGNAPLTSARGLWKAQNLGPGRFLAESDDDPLFVPTDFPVYFTLGLRTALNYMGTGGNVRTEAAMAIYAFGAGAPTPATARVPFPAEATLDEFLAFFGALDPPSAPAQDAALVAQGQMVFQQAHCDSCHHVGQIAMDGVVTYAMAGAGSELLPGQDPSFPRGTIATDPSHFQLQNGVSGGDGGTSDAGIDQNLVNLVTFIIREGLSEHMTDGYRANDLRGLWFTAPYLHNGSVPTLEDLLNPAAMRPATFMRGNFMVDTTQPGNTNVGHEFGTMLSASDKTALVAYLRSL